MGKSVVSISPDVMSGTPVFTGTRVPIKNLTDYLVTGETIETFLDDFPTVSREQVIEFLEMSIAAVCALDGNAVQ